MTAYARRRNHGLIPLKYVHQNILLVQILSQTVPRRLSSSAPEADSRLLLVQERVPVPPCYIHQELSGRVKQVRKTKKSRRK